MKSFIKKYLLFLITCTVFCACSKGDDDDNRDYWEDTENITAPHISASYNNGYVYILWDNINEEEDDEEDYYYYLYMSTSYNGKYQYVEYDNMFSSPNTGVSQMLYGISTPGTYYFKVEVNNYKTSNTVSITIPDSNSGDNTGNSGSNDNTGGGNSGNNNSDNQGSGTIMKPNTPTGINAINVGNNLLPEVKITWDAVSGATSYKVYRSSNSSSGYTCLGTVYEEKYSDWYPKSGKNYYKVTAVNSAGESYMSTYTLYNYDTSSSLVPATPNITISGSSTLSLSWSCASGNSYGKATNYKVYKRDPMSGEYTLVYSGPKTYYSDGNPHPGYNRYSVVAENTAGASGVGYATSTSIPLSRPTGVSASKTGNSVKISWSKVAGATGYQIFQSSQAGGTYYILDQVDNTMTWKWFDFPYASGKIYFKVKAIYDVNDYNPIYSDFSSYTSVTF